MEWYLKSEVDGRKINAQDYILETRNLFNGKRKIAICYEKLVYLQNIDMIVLYICILKKVPVPNLFCVDSETIAFYTEVHDTFDAKNALLKYFSDGDSPGKSHWFKFTNYELTLNQVIDSLINIPADQKKESIIKEIKIVHDKIISWQREFASEFMYGIEGSDPALFLNLVNPLYIPYQDFLTSISESINLVQSYQKHNVFSEGDEKKIDPEQMNGKKIPQIILDLEKEKLLIREKTYFYPSVSGLALSDILTNDQKLLLRNIFVEWIKKRNGSPFRTASCKQYLKPR